MSSCRVCGLYLRMGVDSKQYPRWLWIPEFRENICSDCHVWAFVQLYPRVLFRCLVMDEIPMGVT